MTGNKRSTAVGWVDPDDAPDLSTPDYQAKLAATTVRRGRPKAKAPKVRIGFRLSADVVASVRASGRGYNARVEQALRKAGFGMDEAVSGDSPKEIAKEGEAAKKAKLAKKRPAFPGGKAGRTLGRKRA
jgi:uncharacterized protein (DUF4415 family)